MNIHDPQAVAREPAAGTAPLTASQAELETQIAKFFAETFNVEHVGPDEDFFDLGGDSLLGESLAASISQFTGRDFQISVLVNRSTPRKIASFLLPQASELSAAGKRPPIFMVHGQRGYILPRPEFLGGLAPGQRLVMFELPGIRSERPPCTTVEEIAAEYVRQLEAEYPAGPVLLGGYCGGCVIVLEMAAQLANRGRPVLQMVLFDPGSTRNIHENFRRHQGVVEPESGLQWVKHQLRYLRHFLLLGRWTDGSLDEDFTDERLKSLRERLMKLKSRYSSLRRRQTNLGGNKGIWNDAQIKMFVAFQHYRPRPFEGAVTVYSSREFDHQFERDRGLWAYLLPNCELHVLGETHQEVLQAQAATGAKMMQEVFDKALTGALTGARSE